MSSFDALPLRFELLQSDDFSRYMLRDHTEIRFLMRQLIDHRAMVSVYFGPTNDFLLSSLLGLSPDERSLYIDWGRDEAINLRVAASDSLSCITQLDKVKIQFQLRSARPDRLNGMRTFTADVPDFLLRLQRREYFRLATPTTQGVTCSVPIAAGDSPEQRVEATVLDISGGGLAVMVPPEGATFEPDMEFSHCRITLPEIGVIEGALRVRNLFRITGPQGRTMLRAGCEFINLPESQVSKIQRYILRVERERSASISRLAGNKRSGK